MIHAENIGRFKHQSTLAIHSYQAARLCEGQRIKSGNKRRFTIPGLLVFGAMIKAILKASQMDDPYADQALLEIERRIDGAFKTMEELSQQLESDMKKVKLPKNLTITACESETPAKVDLSHAMLSSVYSKQVVLLIATCDEFIGRLAAYTT